MHTPVWLLAGLLQLLWRVEAVKQAATPVHTRKQQTSVASGLPVVFLVKTFAVLLTDVNASVTMECAYRYQPDASVEWKVPVDIKSPYWTQERTWMLDISGAMTRAVQAQLTIERVQREDTGNYRCVVTAGSKSAERVSVATAIVQLQVRPEQPEDIGSTVESRRHASPPPSPPAVSMGSIIKWSKPVSIPSPPSAVSPWTASPPPSPVVVTNSSRRPGSEEKSRSSLSPAYAGLVAVMCVPLVLLAGGLLVPCCRSRARSAARDIIPITIGLSNHSCIIRTDSQNSYVSGQQASLFGGSTAPPCSVTSDRPSGLVLPGIGAHRTPGARSGSDQTYCTIEEPSSCLDNAPGNTYQDSPNPPSSSSHTRSSPWHGAVSGRHHLKDSIRRRIASIGRALELRRHATETPPMLTSNSGG
eukprot:scpid89836/ scgid2802/ 